MDLYERDALIAAAIIDHDAITVLAGLNLVYQADGTVFIGGVITHPVLRNRGLGSATLALTLQWLSQVGVGAAELCVRIKPDGEINTAAYAMFIKCGFRPFEDYRVAVSGSNSDVHLMDSAEDDGSFRVRKMRADLTLRKSKMARVGDGRST